MLFDGRMIAFFAFCWKVKGQRTSFQLSCYRCKTKVLNLFFYLYIDVHVYRVCRHQSIQWRIKEEGGGDRVLYFPNYQLIVYRKIYLCLKGNNNLHHPHDSLSYIVYVAISQSRIIHCACTNQLFSRYYVTGQLSTPYYFIKLHNNKSFTLCYITYRSFCREDLSQRAPHQSENVEHL